MEMTVNSVHNFKEDFVRAHSFAVMKNGLPFKDYNWEVGEDGVGRFCAEENGLVLNVDGGTSGFNSFKVGDECTIVASGPGMFQVGSKCVFITPPTHTSALFLRSGLDTFTINLARNSVHRASDDEWVRFDESLAEGCIAIGDMTADELLAMYRLSCGDSTVDELVAVLQAK